jgi:peroxiredoxin
MDRRVLLPLVAVIVAVAIAATYYLVGRKTASLEREAPQQAGMTAWNGDPATLLSTHKGRVLVLLLGMQDCPGTRAATEFLTGYAGEMPEGASVVRLDVPPPGGQLEEAGAAKLPFACGVDRDRLVASKLDFFYYPTLYILDRDGEVRFTGECDPERVPQMVAEILAERPGEPKHVYTPPLPAVGTAPPAFSGTTLDGETVTLDELRGQKATVLIFARTACSFTVEALPSMQQLANDFRDKEVTVVVVNGSEPAETIRLIYAGQAPGMTVIDDGTGEISASYSGNAVPYSFVLDGEGRVAARMPYTFDDATRAVNELLGLADEAPAAPQTGAG